MESPSTEGQFVFNYLEIILIFMGGATDDNPVRKWKLKSIYVNATMKTELGLYFSVVKPIYRNEISLSGGICMSLK